MEITKTVLSLMLVVITILTTLTLTTIAAYAGGEDDNGDGNKNKAEDDSSAALADCDENDVEQAGFDCIAIAASEIETQEEESATLTVCKESTIENAPPSSFTFTVEGNNPFPDEFAGDDSDSCVDVTIGPGQFAVTEAAPGGLAPGVQIEEGCDQDPLNPQRATGVIEAGDRVRCLFVNSPGGG